LSRCDARHGIGDFGENGKQAVQNARTNWDEFVGDQITEDAEGNEVVEYNDIENLLKSLTAFLRSGVVAS
jgi:hypothetical protein